MDDVLTSSIHVGNPDIVSEFVYENSEDLVDIIGKIKELEGVDRVLWSEEIFKVPSHKENIMKSFNKYYNSHLINMEVKERKIKKQKNNSC